MRSAIVIATGIGVGVLALAGLRLADSIGHVRTLASSLPSSSADGENVQPRVPTATRIEAAIASFASAPVDAADVALPQPAAAASGDERILRWLAADPEFERAANELLRDRDPEVRREAQVFLRELGVATGAGEGGR